MDISYSEHAKKRMRQRGITRLEVQHILDYPSMIRKSYDERIEAIGTIKSRTIKVVFTIESPKYIKVITVV